jgi:hypothetical protein
METRIRRKLQANFFKVNKNNRHGCTKIGLALFKDFFSKIFVSGGSTVVQHTSHLPKVKGSSPGAAGHLGNKKVLYF